MPTDHNLVATMVAHMERTGGARVHLDSPHGQPAAYARLVSCDQRDGFCVLQARAEDNEGFHFASFGKHARSWRPRFTDEAGVPAGYATHCSYDAARGAVTLDVQVMDRTALTKLGEGCLTGLLVPLRTTG